MAHGVLTVGELAELTAANNELFGKQIRTALNGHTTIEIDWGRTIFMACAGLGTLTALRKFARSRDGVRHLANPTPAVQQLFDVVRAERMFRIVNTRATDPSQHGSQSASSPFKLVPSFSAPLPVACTH